MRPLTDSEYKRMRSQAESRYAGMSEISFKLAAKNNGDPTLTEWYETNFLCDFVIGGFNSRYNESTGIARWAVEDGYIDRVGATCSLPMRYIEDDSVLKIKSKDPEVASHGWLGMPFTINQTAEVGITSGATEFPPIVVGIRLDIHNNNVPPVDYDYKIVSNPYVSPECFELNLRGEAKVENYTIFDDNTRQGSVFTYGRLLLVNGQPTLVWGASPFNSRQQAKAYARSVKGTIWTSGRSRSIR